MSWLFLRRANFNFIFFKHWNFSFSISALVEQIWMTFYGKAMLNQEDRISRSDTARQRVWEREKMSQSQAIFLCVCFTCRSKGHASWLWLVVFDPNFFYGWETFYPRREPASLIFLICSRFSVNSVVYQVTSVGLWYKTTWSERFKGKIWRFLAEERAQWLVKRKHETWHEYFTPLG